MEKSEKSAICWFKFSKFNIHWWKIRKSHLDVDARFSNASEFWWTFLKRWLYVVERKFHHVLRSRCWNFSEVKYTVIDTVHSGVSWLSRSSGHFTPSECTVAGAAVCKNSQKVRYTVFDLVHLGVSWFLGSSTSLHTVLQCVKGVAVCCRCCSVLQCVAECCRCCSVLQCVVSVTVCCSVVCCSVLQCFAVCCRCCRVL